MKRRKIHIGPNGGRYILINGKKRYVSRTRNIKSKKSRYNKFGATGECNNGPYFVAHIPTASANVWEFLDFWVKHGGIVCIDQGNTFHNQDTLYLGIGKCPCSNLSSTNHIHLFNFRGDVVTARDKQTGREIDLVLNSRQAIKDYGRALWEALGGPR
jgi:hypothetical protein